MGHGSEAENREEFREDLKELTEGSMADRVRELVPAGWGLVGETTLTSGFCAKKIRFLNRWAPAEEWSCRGAV